MIWQISNLVILRLPLKHTIKIIPSFDRRTFQANGSSCFFIPKPIHLDELPKPKACGTRLMTWQNKGWPLWGLVRTNLIPKNDLMTSTNSDSHCSPTRIMPLPMLSEFGVRRKCMERPIWALSDLRFSLVQMERFPRPGTRLALKILYRSCLNILMRALSNTCQKGGVEW